MYHFLPTLTSFMKLAIALSLFLFTAAIAVEKPHIILVMADDQGWGQTSYNGHPDLKTPHLDEMAENGLRFDRFYAGASNCSPSRATVMTGRTNDRTGVQNHGYPLRLQEKTLPQALRNTGYTTAHFGKWHLNGLRGPGAPILAGDTHNPGAFGFDHWLSVTNYFDRDPLLSRMGEFEDFEGDSSEVVIPEALKWIEKNASEKPTFTVVWYGTPHDPMIASEADQEPFAELPDRSRNQYGEILAMDRSIAALRKGLRDQGIADNTLIWYCSDNGGLPGFGPDTMGGLRGTKNTMYEGGLRVPGIIEWPARIPAGRVTDFPAGTVDIFPTIAEIVGIPDSAMLKPQDGLSLLPLIDGKEDGRREKPLIFRHDGRGVLNDGRYKLIARKGEFELYDLEEDQAETNDIFETEGDVASWMKKEWAKVNQSIENSVAGKDYPSGEVDPDQPDRRFWHEDPAYQPFLEELSKRPRYGSWIEKQTRGATKGKGKRGQ